MHVFGQRLLRRGMLVRQEMGQTPSAVLNGYLGATVQLSPQQGATVAQQGVTKVSLWESD